MGKQPAKGRAKKQQKSQEAPAPEAAPKRDKARRSQRLQKKSSQVKDDLEERLHTAGLVLRKVAADGNCWFRALADQLQGTEGGHMQLRHDTVKFMQEHEADFAPFLEDNETFVAYCKRMNKDGTWAGQQEQVAAARAFGIKIAVYQAGQPCWIIAAPQSAGCPKDARLVHVSYHDGDHYNSVRSSEDSMSGLPLPVPESCCAAFSGAPVPPEAQQAAEEKKVSQVMIAVASEDRQRVVDALARHGGRQDEAIEALIAEDATEPPETASVAAAPELAASSAECTTAEPSGTGASEPGPSAPDGHGVPVASQPGDPSAPAAACEPDKQAETAAPEVSSRKHDSGQPQAPRHKGKVKGTGRNQPCPCGSHKKHKNCCGAARGDAQPSASDSAAGLPRQVLAPLYV